MKTLTDIIEVLVDMEIPEELLVEMLGPILRSKIVPRDQVEKNDALCFVSSGNNVEIARLLIQVGADVNIKNHGISILCQASECGNIEMVRLLVALGANINPEDEDILFQAVSEGQIEVVRFLLRVGINVKDDDELLTYAAMGDSSGEITRLLKGTTRGPPFVSS